MFSQSHPYKYVSNGRRTSDVVNNNYNFEMHSWDIGDEFNRGNDYMISNNQPPRNPTRIPQETDSEPLLRLPLSDSARETHLITPSANEVEKSPHYPSPPQKRFAGWQQCVIFSCTCTVVALFCNIGLLAGSLTKSSSQNGTHVLYEGDCDYSKTILTWSHLGINILSTMILAGTNYAMQVLVAPTRENLDTGHSLLRSLDVGISGFTNWPYLGRRRRWLYLGLLITSLPLHLLYNSVIFGTVSAYNVDMYQVSQDFLQVQPISQGSLFEPTDNVYILWEELQNGNWTRLDVDTCYSTFSVDVIHNYRNVALVTDLTSSDYNGSSWVSRQQHITHAIVETNWRWFCAHGSDDTCQPDQSQADNWLISTYNQPTAKVQYCMAQPGQPSCTVELMPQLLGIVIGCNILKAVALVILLFFRFNPLLTIGDAICSFMDRPDSRTKGWSTVTAMQLRLQERGPLKYSTPAPRAQPWKSQRQRYFSGAAPSRWVVTIFLCTLYWGIGCALETLSVNNANASLQRQVSEGLGAILTKSTAMWDVPVVAGVLIANTPQLILSLVYLFYNGLFTCMLLSAEWMDFAHERKGLRVTRPTGNQRSTYFLSLPYKFSVPLIIASVLLHWMLSESLFLVQINTYSPSGDADPEGSIHTVGWSPLALMILLIIGGLLIVGVIGFGFRRYPTGMPLVLSDSRAISAACHPVEGASTNQSREKLMYGVIPQQIMVRQEDDEQKAENRHVGFSSGTVEPLVDGETYS